MIREYTFDRIDNTVRFAGSNEQVMFDESKRRIINCDINVNEWNSQPKIGDKIKYVYREVGEKYPPILLEIYLNEEIVWLKPKR